jgi:hypothetical protein
MPRRLQCEYVDCIIIYLLNSAESNGQQADGGTLIKSRGFIRSARLLPNSIEFRGDLSGAEDRSESRFGVLDDRLTGQSIFPVQSGDVGTTVRDISLHRIENHLNSA